MSDIKYVSEQSFHSEVEMSKLPVLVDFYADWCGPCKMIQPELEKLANECDSILVAKVNVDENNNLAEKFNISNIPCMILFKDGEPEKTIIGYRTAQQLKTLIAE